LSLLGRLNMMFVFAYIGSKTGSHDWPVALMHVTEAVLLILAVACVAIAVTRQGKGPPLWRDAVAIVGGVSAGVGMIMPFELAPFFFHARGEVMLGTIVLILAYPVLVIPFVIGLRKLINGERLSIKRGDGGW
jgi:thiosulfate dehydrogenase (quinone) large subunit